MLLEGNIVARPPRRQRPIRSSGGLRARVVRSDGKRAYWRAVEIVRGADGRAREKTVATTWLDGTASTQEQAALVWLQQIEKGAGTKAPVRAGPVVRDVRWLLATYMGDRVKDEHARANTLLALRGCVRRIVGTSKQGNRRAMPAVPLADVLVSRLESYHLVDYVRAATASGAAASTAELTARVVVQAWNWARDRGLAPDRRLREPPAKAGRVRPDYHPSPDEIERVVRFVARTRPRHAAGLSLLRYTGLRVGELMSLELQHIDRRGGAVTFEIPDIEGCKTGARSVPVPVAALPDLELLIAGRTAPAERLVAGSGKAFEMRMGSVCRAAAKACGVRPFVLHGLRKSFTDQLWMAGADPGVIASVMGHSAQMSVDLYRRARPLEASAAVARAAEALRPKAGSVLSLPVQHSDPVCHNPSSQRVER